MKTTTNQATATLAQKPENALRLAGVATNQVNEFIDKENTTTGNYWLSTLTPQVYAADKTFSRIMPLSMYRAAAGQILLKKAVEGLPETELTAERVGTAVLAAAAIVNSIPETGVLSSNKAGYSAVSGSGGTAVGAAGKGIYRVTAEPVAGVDLTVPERVNVGVNGDGAVLIGVAAGKGRVKIAGELRWWEKPMMRVGEWIAGKVSAAEIGREVSETSAAEVSETAAATMPLTVQLFIDENKNGKMDSGEEPAKLAGVKVNLTPETKTVNYQLTEGWNFIAFPVAPESVKTAAELIQDVALDGGYVTTVATWEGDKWAEFSQRGAQKFGQDFELQPGRGYFLNAHKDSGWSLAGMPLPADKTVLQLRKGWNGVGLAVETVTTAVQILDDIQSATPAVRSLSSEASSLAPESVATAGFGRTSRFSDENLGSSEETADQVARWDFGLWEVVVKRRYSSEHHEIYGRDFPIKETEGYFVHANEDVRFQ